MAETRAREEQDALVQEIGEIKGVPDFASLLDLNVRQMRVYQELSTSQARTSYRRSQFAFLIGLALIASAVAFAFVANDTSTKVTASAVAALGGAVSAYISGTYLRVYERTLDQLNFYYRQPLVNSYLLTAERLANAIPADKRDGAYERLLEKLCVRLRPIRDLRQLGPRAQLRRGGAVIVRHGGGHRRRRDPTASVPASRRCRHGARL